MNRLQKKCFIGATGLHLLLVVVLFVGPAFFVADKVDDSEVITFIPDLLTDRPFSNPGATAPRPAPQAEQPPQPQPQPVVEPPKPQPAPEPERQPQREPDPPKVATPKVNKPDPDAVEPEKVKKPTTRQVQVSDKVVKLSRDTKTTTKTPSVATASNQRSQQVNTALRNIRGNLSTTTKVEMPEGPGGGSGVSYANYAQEVRRVYTQAVNITPDVEDEAATVEVRVTIARSGNVISSSIVKSTGSRQADRAIQATLDRVNFVAPFPAGAKETERTFIISFELKAKKLLG